MINRHTVNRNGEIVPDERQLAPEYQDPNGSDWHGARRNRNGDVITPGTPIYAPRRSSPARDAYKAERLARREAARHPGRAAIEAVANASNRQESNDE